MRRILVCALLALSCIALGAQEKLFKAALKGGRETGKFYVIDNPKNQYIDAGKLRDYARSQYYVLGNVRTKSINRFGDSAESLDYLEFLPQAELEQYVFECMTGLKATPGAASLQDSQKGSAVVYLGGKNPFLKLSDIVWTGSFADGALEGKGTGFRRFADYEWICFTALFHKGLPVGNFTMQFYRPGKGSLFNKGAISTAETQVGSLAEDRAAYLQDGKFGFINADGRVIAYPTWPSVTSGFAKHGDRAYAVVKADDGMEYKVGTDGKTFAYSDAQQAILDKEKAEKEAAERKAAEERRLAAEKAAIERHAVERTALAAKEEAIRKRKEYLALVKELSDKSCWQQGDRLCLEFGKPGRYITGTLEEWNGDKSKCKIKIVTSPGSRVQYNGENLEKNNTMWIAASGEGWHKALPEEIELANKTDNSTHHETHTIETTVLCPECGGKKYKEYTSRGWFGTSTSTEKCWRCNGVGFIQKTQTF